MQKRRAFAAVVALALASGCGGGGAGATDETAAAGGDETFLPFVSDFDGYPAWESFDLPHGDMPDLVHDPNAKLVAYLNKAPPVGATEFPVGTIIVKEVVAGPEVGRNAFAMAKRGGGYNEAGAVNWEWFDLTRLDGDAVTINWSGIGPASGTMYGGDPNACNDCHAGASGNDFVWSLDLDSVAR